MNRKECLVLHTGQPPSRRSPPFSKASSAALLAPPSDYVALKAGFKRLVNLADLFKDTSFSGLAATGKTIRENPQFVKRMVRAIVRGVIHSREYPEDAAQTMVKHWRMERDVSIDAYNLVKDALNPVPTEKGVDSWRLAWPSFDRHQAPSSRVLDRASAMKSSQISKELRENVSVLVLAHFAASERFAARARQKRPALPT